MEQGIQELESAAQILMVTSISPPMCCVFETHDANIISGITKLCIK